MTHDALTSIYARTLRVFAFVACATVSVQSLFATSFVVPPDRELIRQATAIVVASPIASHTEIRGERTIETVTTLSIEDVLKGRIADRTLEVWEPGGTYGKRVSSIPGVPRFADGERYLLFLIRTDEGLWRVLNLALGKFTFNTDVSGHRVVARELRDVGGWDPDGKPHREGNRAEEPFLDFIRTRVQGGPASEEYMLPEEALLRPAHNPFLARKHVPVTLSTFEPYTYTFEYAGSTGARWNVFPGSVNFYSTGANSAALTALSNAIAAWNNDAGSNVNLAYAGADASGTHTGGAATADGQNTVAFERNLTASYGAPGFNCTANSYGGTLGVAAVTNDNGSHIGPGGNTFFTATEGDAEMNQGLSTCTFFINLGDFDSAVAHELGHTLGFRHSDQERNLFPGPAPSCASDTTIECTNSAIMKASIPSGLHGVLQAFDQHAVDLVYPNATLAAPTSVVATAASATSVSVSWTAASGATSYRVYRSSDHLAYSLVGSPVSSPYTDSTASANTAYLYKVRAFDGVSESTDSNIDLATTVMFTESLTAGVSTIKAVHFTELRTAVSAVRTLAGLGAYSFSDATLDSSVTVKAVHLTDLRTALTAARSTLGLSTLSYTDPTVTATSTIVKTVHVTELRAGVQ